MTAAEVEYWLAASEIEIAMIECHRSHPGFTAGVEGRRGKGWRFERESASRFVKGGRTTTFISHLFHRYVHPFLFIDSWKFILVRKDATAARGLGVHVHVHVHMHAHASLRRS